MTVIGRVKGGIEVGRERKNVAGDVKGKWSGTKRE